MGDTTLGRLMPVDLHDIWDNEATAFTPWLAQEENLQLLGEALGIELQLEAQEKDVGPFRADILCKDMQTDDWVVIENQLVRTDHSHLGQLLTYAAGLQAATIVWIAARFTEEHRAALDWLNDITDERFRFFGIEMELWRIDPSPPAPRFNLVSRPNDWSKSVSAAARQMDWQNLSEVQRLQLEYWQALLGVLKDSESPVNPNRKPGPMAWMGWGIGRSGFGLNAVMLRLKRQLRVELYLGGPDAKACFHLLHGQKEEIEQEIGYSLEWEELPQNQDSRIAIYLNDADPEVRDDWQHQHEWLSQKLADFKRVFAGRVKSLNPSEWTSDEAAQ